VIGVDQHLVQAPNVHPERADSAKSAPPDGAAQRLECLHEAAFDSLLVAGSQLGQPAFEPPLVVVIELHADLGESVARKGTRSNRN
jgi:hypothetical protein